MVQDYFREDRKRANQSPIIGFCLPAAVKYHRCCRKSIQSFRFRYSPIAYWVKTIEGKRECKTILQTSLLSTKSPES
jgi:hypothetical protein